LESAAGYCDGGEKFENKPGRRCSNAVESIEKISHFGCEDVQQTEEDRIMGNLNFQDEQNENPQQNQPDPAAHKATKEEDAYIDDPTSNSRILWIAIIVVAIAGIGGALYMLNNAGYLKFLSKHKTAVTTIATSPAPSEMTAVSKPTSTQPAKAMAKQSGTFALQLSAFRTQGQADRCVATLKKKGVDAWVASTETATDKKWYRVCTGSYETKLKAIAAVETMKKKVGTDVWVVPAQ
jgi:cell division protein FtsN